MIYVASPYSHKEKRVREHRFLMAEWYVATAMKQQLKVFSPIVYAHALAERYQLPTDAQYWKNFNNAMMRRAEYLNVLDLVGWRESKGVQYELMMAEELGIPIIHVQFPTEKFPEGVEL